MSPPISARPEPTAAELRHALAEFEAAVDRDSARSAAGRILDAAQDDGVAVSSVAADAVHALVGLVSRQRTPWLADAFAVLREVARCLGVWREAAARAAGKRARAAGKRSATPQVGWEEQTRAALQGFDAVVRDQVLHDDPEVRSMASLLLASISTEPSLDLSILRMTFAADRDDLARACLAEAILRLSQQQADWSGDGTRAEFGQRLMAGGDGVVRRRLAQYFAPRGDDRDPGDGGEAVVAMAAAVVDAERLVAGGYWWPAEQL